MQSNDRGLEGFVMLFTDYSKDTLLTALRNREVQLRDVAVLMALILHCDWRSGRVRVTQKALAAALGIHASDCSAAIRRLQAKRLRLVARVRDPHTGEQYFLINPDLAAVGGAQRRGHLDKQFNDAFGDEDGP